MLKILLVTVVLEFILSLSSSDALAIQNITIYENINSTDMILSSQLDIELFLVLFTLVFLIISGAFLYNKVIKKNLDSQSPVQKLQSRMEVLETIIVNSDD